MPPAIDMSGPALASGSPQKRKKISGEGDFVKGAIGKSFGLLCVFVYGWKRGGQHLVVHGSCTISPLATPLHTPRPMLAHSRRIPSLTVTPLHSTAFTRSFSACEAPEHPGLHRY
jgi:hypothetical protein